MKKFLVRTLATIGGVYLASLLLLGIWFALKNRKGDVPRKTVLVLSLDQEPVEDFSDDPLSQLMGSPPLMMRDILFALERASHDARVQGLLLQGSVPLGLAHAQEIRDAVVRFRGNQKFAIAFMDTFGEFGPGMSQYFLASGFDQIWLQPSGDIGLTGVSAEVPFIRGTLDKLGITPRLDHRREYKNAMNSFTEKKFTPAHREATDAIVKSLFSQMVRGISEGRHLSEEQVKYLVDQGPYIGEEALKAKLADRMGYRDEVVAFAKQKAGDAELLGLPSYLERVGRPYRKGKSIALIYGIGSIARGESGHRSMLKSDTMGADTIASAFRAAVKDPEIKAILFRVDSPGGSYVASDTIWRETVRAKQAGKPVIVSMGDVAGSGGYFVAMAADRIVAQPATLTGSIGVFGGKAVLAGLWEKLGLSWDEAHVGARATMWSTNKDYSPSEWTRIQSWLDHVYEDFTSKVALGRKLPKAKVLDIAKGRVWTGEDAKARGLVDELGGFMTALGDAKKAAGIAESEEVKLVLFPARRRPIEQLIDRVLGRHEDEDPNISSALSRSVGIAWERLGPLLQPLEALVESADAGVLKMGSKPRLGF